MSLERLTRRRFLSATAYGALAATGGPLVAQSVWSNPSATSTPSRPAANALETQLDAYIAAYMPAMNAPAMTLGLTDASKTLRTVGYGFANIDSKLAVNPDHLFQIGSITKSFVALVLLQLREEGKLDLHKPILDYLPWLPITEEFGPIAVHHLLTHTSGLPDASSIFLSAPESRHMQGFLPGEHFHYCNLGFAILGALAAKLDGRPWSQLVAARILTPLQMNDTQPVITNAGRPRAAIGYQPFWDDEPYPRHGRLAVSSNLVTDDTAGCIQSTPGDMARYLRMLVNRGKTPTGRIVSEESFALFSTAYIKAEEFSPTASYGYGIAVDTLDGRKILRYTGGMIAFASSIHVDLDGGVAAFASINAMQGYRPTAVTEYAVRLMRAEREAKPMPPSPAIANLEEIQDASDYAGTFTAPDGSMLVFRADGKRLTLVDREQSIPLQSTSEDSFISTISGRYSNYGLIFKRTPEKRNPEKPESTAKIPGKPGKIMQVSYGPQWYVAQDYSGPRTFEVPVDYGAFVGRYRSESVWGSDVRVFVLQGKLLIDDIPLTRIGGSLFRLGEEPWTPDTAEFHSIVEGKGRLLKIVGADCWRIDMP
jgi:D-alanyl-D-alanine carboxypeptidase